MNILIAEDDTTSRLTLAATLRKFGHQVTAVSTGKAALQAWERDVYPLLISDWMMMHQVLEHYLTQYPMNTIEHFEKKPSTISFQ